LMPRGGKDSFLIFSVPVLSDGACAIALLETAFSMIALRFKPCWFAMNTLPLQALPQRFELGLRPFNSMLTFVCAISSVTVNSTSRIEYLSRWSWVLIVTVRICGCLFRNSTHLE